MQINLIGGAAQAVQISEKVFNQTFNEALVHQVVTACLAGMRQGSHAQKNRSAVSGGGKKPWRQKGTGRARAGTTRSPIWRKGGVTFAAQPQDYSQKVNKKMHKGAVRSILSELLRQERLLVVDTFSLESKKTKSLIEQLKKLNAQETLIILDTVDENVYLAARNLPNVDVSDAASIDIVSLIRFPKVVITLSALRQFEEQLA